MKVALTLFCHPPLPSITENQGEGPWTQPSSSVTQAVEMCYHGGQRLWFLELIIMPVKARNYSMNGPHSQGSVWGGDLPVTQPSNKLRTLMSTPSSQTRRTGIKRKAPFIPGHKTSK